MDGLASLQVGEPVLSASAVGVGEHEIEATYALVDVDNAGDLDLLVSLGGELLGEAGEVVSPARTEVLLVPGHGRRTFALVADPARLVAGARRARAEVRRSESHPHPPTVLIEDGHVYADGDRVVVKGRAVNRREASARAVVIGAFYGESGAPMSRTFSVLPIEGGQSHPIEFVGPPGSRSAYIFVGDVGY